MSHGPLLNKPRELYLQGCCDTDWGTDPDDRMSVTGYCLMLGSNLITWSLKKQPTVARSSTEAGYRSRANATSEFVWVQSLLKDLRIQSTRVPILWCDNTSTVALSANPILHSRTKHIELDLFFVREKVLNKSLSVQHVPTLDQAADIFTEAVPSTHFHRLKINLQVVAPTTLSLRGNVKR